MTVINAKNTKSLVYADKTIARAERALICSPFQVNLFEAMRRESVPTNAIAQAAGIENNYTHSNLAELAAENYLLWLIQVGVLRREVDGQGITDSFRLTPLGSQLIEQKGKWRNPTWRDRLLNAAIRYLRLPF
ncbi:Npun_F0494 family protein [Aliterella atlantica]|uniref:Uncharacterized protein n=1 Tax=Aliterella atlantica CENA595 TaxID=1618023 RepID=A0A0D8ZR65_9CYAN|nr:Npun_F0494 family protein [Aliterella atlantica]KJH71298.1 hypothetical protein UH38_13520 [Aliterella atlantica CENA595]